MRGWLIPIRTFLELYIGWTSKWEIPIKMKTLTTTCLNSKFIGVGRDTRCLINSQTNLSLWLRNSKSMRPEAKEEFNQK